MAEPGGFVGSSIRKDLIEHVDPVIARRKVFRHHIAACDNTFLVGRLETESDTRFAGTGLMRSRTGRFVEDREISSEQKTSLGVQ